MTSTVLSKEFISTERKAVILESIGLLLDVQKRRQLSAVERVALNALRTLHSRCLTPRGPAVTHDEMRDLVAFAQAAADTGQLV